MVKLLAEAKAHVNIQTKVHYDMMRVTKLKWLEQPWPHCLAQSVYYSVPSSSCSYA